MRKALLLVLCSVLGGGVYLASLESEPNRSSQSAAIHKVIANHDGTGEQSYEVLRHQNVLNGLHDKNTALESVESKKKKTLQRIALREKQIESLSHEIKSLDSQLVNFESSHQNPKALQSNDEYLLLKYQSRKISDKRQILIDNLKASQKHLSRL